jgi:hypothetical protein
MHLIMQSLKCHLKLTKRPNIQHNNTKRVSDDTSVITMWYIHEYLLAYNLRLCKQKFQEIVWVNIIYDQLFTANKYMDSK